jgi:hypothetical protein
MSEVFANNAYTTLSAPVTTTGATTINVSSVGTPGTPGGFPTTGNFRILIDSEYMLVTGVSGTTFTVTRGIEGSTAATHTVGAQVTQIVTAGALGALGSAGGGATYAGILTASGAIPAGHDVIVGFNSSAFGAGLGPAFTMSAGALVGDRVKLGDAQGAANTNPATLTDPNGYFIQNPQGPGFVFGDGVHLGTYHFDESGGWRQWMLVQDTNPGGRGTFWAAIQ